MTQIFATRHVPTTDKDISSPAFWSRSFEARDETFAWLRQNAPVSWHPPLEDEGLPPEVHKEAGFWAVTRYADIQFASQHQDLFSSALGGTQIRPRDPAMSFSASFLEMDPPEHTRYRQVMSAAFTPKAVARLNDKIAERAKRIVGNVVGAGDIDFVVDVSAKLPMLTIADMVGVPESLVETFAQAGDHAVSLRDDAVRPDGVSPVEFFMEQARIVREIGVDIVNFRRTHPADDIATALANAEFDGQRVTDDQIMSVMLLLAVAGNDTTKQTTSLTVLELDRNPDQRAWLVDDFDGRIAGAVEEFVRHATPVIEFARTATEDVELGGQQIKKWDKVGLFYCSGNRDESVFEQPHRFDLRRSRKAHVGFGGGGVHFCLGNGVAKAQLRSLFAEILTQLPNLEITGEPQYLPSEFIHGIQHLPARTN